MLEILFSNLTSEVLRAIGVILVLIGATGFNLPSTHVVRTEL